MEKERVLSQSMLFQHMKANELPLLLDCLKSRTATFAKEYTILDEGDITEEIGIVLAGSLNIVRHDYWGNRTVVANIAVGGTFAESMACSQVPSAVAAVTAECSTILFLNIHKVLTTCSIGCVYHHTLVENLVRLLSQKNLELMKKINHITKRSTREKLLSYLSEEAKKHPKQTSFSIPFDRQQLADYLCVERSAMSSELSKMRDEGILEYHRSSFTLYSEE